VSNIGDSFTSLGFFWIIFERLYNS